MTTLTTASYEATKGHNQALGRSTDPHETSCTEKLHLEAIHQGWIEHWPMLTHWRIYCPCFLTASSWPPSTHLKAHKKYTPMSFYSYVLYYDIASRSGSGWKSRSLQAWQVVAGWQEVTAGSPQLRWGSCFRTSSRGHPGQQASEDEGIQWGWEGTCEIYSVKSLKVIGQLENPQQWKVMLFSWSF